MKILIINGPNLNMLGVREPHIYGSQSFDSYFDSLKNQYPDVSFGYFQSNSEGDLIDCIQREGFTYDGIVINAGAYTHTSVAIADALSAVKSPAIEVHLSNVFRRESFRHHSFLSPVVKGVIGGFGLDSYRLAVEALFNSNK
ncbi:type II 3-dehydroquinate dehydratase [Alkaliflexus imshenetskii]|uniref:type II 3-dehydroquinate dehydratase n=1 Tax=Alkaliflexus imshenetskii TaxID=286730 RepID=UPI0004B52972|nr:type II 3-dehydroquinate dehydratase [Alkaliflexus imshenetskii]